MAGFFTELGLVHKEIQEGMWLVQDASGIVENIVVHHVDPVVAFRVKIMEVPPQRNNEDLFRELLTLNASEMIHGAYALEGDSIVAVDTLQSATLDLGEVQGTIDSLSLAVTTHLPRLARYHSAS